MEMNQYPRPDGPPAYNQQFQPPPPPPSAPQQNYDGGYPQYDQYPKQPVAQGKRTVLQKLLVLAHGLLCLAGIILFIITIYTIVRTVQILSWSTVFVFFILFAVTSIAADILKITFIIKQRLIPAWILILEVLAIIFFILRWVLLFWATDLSNLWDDKTDNGDDFDLIAPTLAVIVFTWIVFVGRLLSMAITLIWAIVRRRRNRRQNMAV